MAVAGSRGHQTRYANFGFFHNDITADVGSDLYREYSASSGSQPTSSHRDTPPMAGQLSGSHAIELDRWAENKCSPSSCGCVGNLNRHTVIVRCPRRADSVAAHLRVAQNRHVEATTARNDHLRVTRPTVFSSHSKVRTSDLKGINLIHNVEYVGRVNHNPIYLRLPVP